MSEVIVVIDPGLTGRAIARRIGMSEHGLLAAARQDNADLAAGVPAKAGMR